MNTKYDDLLSAVQELVRAERASLVACIKRGSLPHGSSRARVTSANADWANKAERRDKCLVAATKRAIRALGIMPGDVHDEIREMNAKHAADPLRVAQEAHDRAVATFDELKRATAPLFRGRDEV